MMRHSVMRIHRDSPPEQSFGAGPVPFVIRFLLGKRNQRPSQTLVEFQRLVRSRFGARPCVLARKDTPTGQVIVSIRKPCPCPGIGWVLVNRLLEIPPALLEIGLSADSP